MDSKTTAAGKAKKDAARLKKVAEAWARGLLGYKCDKKQREVYDRVVASKFDVFYLNFSRRRGKSYLLCLLAITYALKNPNSEVKYAAATAKAVKKIIRPLFRKILKDCPEELRKQIKWSTMDGEYTFPNGSTITVAGCDGQNYDNLRGTEAHLVIVDEAGFIDELDVVFEEVLLPQTLETGAPIVVASTPPRSTAHFAVSIARGCIEKSQQDGKDYYFHQTIFDNPRLTHDAIQNFIMKAARNREVGAYQRSPSFRREFLAEFVVDLDAAVIREWAEMSEPGHDHPLLRATDRPTHFDTYVSSDWGFRRDPTGCLFAYYDFKKAVLVIEDELVMKKARTEEQAVAIKKKEKDLWKIGEDNQPTRPYLRIGDGAGMGAQVNEDMQVLHGMLFIAAHKDKKEALINELRIWIQDGKIVIHPRCKMLAHQLSTTTWNKTHTEFDRNEDGHGDLIDALAYLVRNLHKDHNPFPATPVPAYNVFQVPGTTRTSSGSASAVLAMMGIGNRRN